VKRTPFYDKHVALGAKLVEFGGFEMPVQYPNGIIAEHKTVRDGGVGVFDVSHMGEFNVEGPEALQFLQYLTVNDVAALEPGKAQYSAMTNEQGGIIDDLLVYMRGANHYMLVVNAGTSMKDWAHVNAVASTFDVKLRNDSDATALLAIQGEKAGVVLQKLTDVDLETIPYYTFLEGTLAGEKIIISRTGYTGEKGLELYFSSDPKVASTVWDQIFAAGAAEKIEPIGLGARDTLRLEMGYCLYGNDIDENTTPLEAGLAWITKLKKTPQCLAYPALQKQKEEGLQRKLIGFIIDERGAIARHGHTILDASGEEIGVVTSGTLSPTLGKAIGLGYVPTVLAKPDLEITIEVRPGKRVIAKTTKIPFIVRDTK
jgi:glycine cleavage system T protein (aminomethyltransferase)